MRRRNRSDDQPAPRPWAVALAAGALTALAIPASGWVATAAQSASQPAAQTAPSAAVTAATAADAVLVLDRPTVESLAIPRPELSAMKPAARRRVEELQAALGALIERREPPRPEIGQAFGFLGQMFQALGLGDAAADAYDTAVRLLPEDPRWIYYRALLAHDRGDLERAVTGYRAYLAARAEYLAADLRLGDALLDLGRPQEARVAYAQALEQQPESAAAIYGLGRVAATLGDDRQAVERFRRVLDLAPTANVVSYQLAQAYRRLGDEDAAAGFLALGGDREVPFADPLASTLGSIQKSISLGVLGDLAAAESFSERDFAGFVRANFAGVGGSAEAVARVAADAETDGTALLTLARLRYAAGLLLAEEGEAERAVEVLSAAVEADPSLVDARLQLGNALARAGRFEDALARYDQVIASRPEEAAAWLQRGSARANLGQLDEAAADLVKVLELAPAGPLANQARLRLANLQARQGKTEEAEAGLRAAAEAAAGTPAAAAPWVALAELARQRGDGEAAFADYRRALTADPESGDALAGMASLFGQAGRFPDSAAVYNRLVALQPDNRVARMGEITALVLARQDAAARERLEEALRRRPDDLAFKDVLARHLAAASDPAVRDGERALALALAVYEQVPTPQSMETLAMAYAEAGDYSKAVEWQRKLLAEVGAGDGEAGAGGGDAERDAQLARLRANLRRYEQGRACCADPGS